MDDPDADMPLAEAPLVGNAPDAVNETLESLPVDLEDSVDYLDDIAEGTLPISTLAESLASSSETEAHSSEPTETPSDSSASAPFTETSEVPWDVDTAEVDEFEWTSSSESTLDSTSSAPESAAQETVSASDSTSETTSSASGSTVEGSPADSVSATGVTLSVSDATTSDVITVDISSVTESTKVIPPEQIPSTPSILTTASPTSHSQITTPTIAPRTPEQSASGYMLISSLFAAAVIALIIFMMFRRTSRKHGNAILLVGPSDAGKTAIFAALAHGRSVRTHTSMQVNSAPLGAQRLIDVPGHPRLRGQFAQLLPDARAVVFVVDAGTVARTAPGVAEHLHTVLGALAALQKPPPLLVLAAKADTIPGGQAASRVKSVLERELSRRQAGGVAVEGLGEEGTGAGAGAEGALECTGTSGFRFADWAAGTADVAHAWVPGLGEEKLGFGNEQGEEDGLASIREWLDRLQ